MEDTEITFKTILLGSPFVGKTSLKSKYVNGDFDYHYNVTVGVEFSTKTIRIHDKVNIKLQLWDTAGQEAFKALVRSYYHGGVCSSIGLLHRQLAELPSGRRLAQGGQVVLRR